MSGGAAVSVPQGERMPLFEQSHRLLVRCERGYLDCHALNLERDALEALSHVRVRVEVAMAQLSQALLYQELHPGRVALHPGHVQEGFTRSAPPSGIRELPGLLQAFLR